MTMKKYILPLIILAAGLVSCGKKEAAPEQKAAPAENAGAQAAAAASASFYAPDGTVHELTDASLYAPGVKVPNLTVLDFNAVWCPPCRMLNPVLEEMAEKYNGKVTFVSIDVDTFGPLFMAYQVGELIPVVVFLKPDGSMSYTVGTSELLPASAFESKIDGLLQ